MAKYEIINGVGIIPEGTTEIKEFSFYGCKALKSIIIPKSVIKIEGNAFEECPAIECIKVERGNKVYDSRENCNAIIETATNSLILGCQSTIIPESIIKIGKELSNAAILLNQLLSLKV